jgi:type VI secretion system secreted protein VgrG
MAPREVKVTGEAGEGFLFKRMQGREELGRPFRYRLELLHERHDLALEGLLGRGMTVQVAGFGGKPRPFHGLVAHAAHLGQEGVFGRYEVVLVPWLWFLNRRQDCRIFQRQSVPEIVKAVFDGWPWVADFEPKLDEGYAVRDYCVQYRESDLDFVSRLLEDEGIYFYFRHREGGHTLVLADGPGAHEAAADYARVPYFAPEAHARRERDHIHGWRSLAHVRAGKATLRAFDFEKPRADLTGTGAEPKSHALAGGEVYDYPGGYLELPAGERQARLRLEELQADHARCLAETNAVGLGCGHRFTLERHPRKDQNKAYLVVGAEYEIAASDYRSFSGGNEPGEVFTSRLDLLDLTMPFRPARTTPRPFVHGPQTATVTGPAGEEIHTDKYGRVKVQFHWDRLGKNDQDSSCWVRVSQAWAGAGFGGLHVPRIGQEVIIDFLEGDPDRPIVTGRVYNALNMPPYALPAGAAQSGIKSNSTKGGGGANELMFDDKKGAERVMLHAERDYAGTVGRNASTAIGADETHAVTGKRTTTVGKGDKTTVETQDADLTVSAGSRTVGVAETYALSARTIRISAAAEILIQVGGSSIKLDAAGVTILAPLVKIN